MILIHFANLSSVTLHIGLLRSDGRLEIHLYDQSDPNRIEVGPLKRVPIEATPEIEACIVNRKLQYAVEGHGISVLMAAPTTVKPDGPVFRFYDPKDA
ncbi:MAG: hypothetical protein V1738_02725 [Patescibacteria group bacterium]